MAEQSDVERRIVERMEARHAEELRQAAEDRKRREEAAIAQARRAEAEAARAATPAPAASPAGKAPSAGSSTTPTTAATTPTTAGTTAGPAATASTTVGTSSEPTVTASTTASTTSKANATTSKPTATTSTTAATTAKTIATTTTAAGNGFIRPVEGRISSRFGMRLHPVLKVWKLHDGTDFAVGCNVPIRSAYDGVVTERYYNAGYGNRLMIDHGRVGGRYVTTGYNHATRYVARVGQRVQKGDVIGYVGSTGYSTGCHLHLMLWLDGKVSNPEAWFSF